MHALGVDHTDLNCRNILLDAAGQPWLIDFDKCLRRPDGPWTQANIDRLQRSLRKEQAKHLGLHWQDADWQALLEGYRHTTTAQATA
jgi:3-deoxy-D-manno-octulosonic-acid transferase